ncbi:MAG TPA: MXAN_5187 family protein [Polyangia bacterium]|nr:MXAN_5187 family protein [Polyangia bacterium]
MFLSKIWFIIVTLVAGLALTFALIGPRPAVQKLGVLEGQRLARAQYAAEQMFKVDAHKWIDRVSKLGRDAIVADSLDAASRGAGEWTVLHKTLQDRFRALIPDLATGGISSLVATDLKGRVVARIGDNEAEYGDYIGGAEVIADALRGYLSDDVWGSTGKLTRVAAAPVLSKNHDRFVGALYVGAETGENLVERLKKNLDVDVALLLRGKVIASTRDASGLTSLPDLVEKHAGEIEKVKRTPAIPLQSGKDQLLAVAAPFPGQAGQQQAYYVLLGMQPASTDLMSLLSHTSSDDLKWGNFPWIGVLATLGVMIGIGLFAQRFEVETPLARLRAEVAQLARGEISKIADNRYGGKFGGLARDVNAAMERYTHAPAAPSEMAGKDLNAILGGKPAAGSTFDLPSADSAFAGSDLPPAFGPPPAGGFAPPPPPAFSPPPPSSFAPPPPPPPSAPSGSVFSKPTAPLKSSLAASSTFGSAPAPAPKPSGWAPPPATISAPPAATLPTAALGDAEEEQQDSEATRVVPYDHNEEEAAHFAHVYDEFVQTKKACGEPTAGLTIDKFLQKLRDNKAQLVAKHGCRTVRFSVYVKDGKAALKATPVRE